jgi:hypothetical protein
MEHEIRPTIEGDAPLGDYVVDEVAVSASHVQNTAVARNKSLEIVAPQRTPNDVASAIRCKSRPVIAGNH